MCPIRSCPSATPSDRRVLRRSSSSGAKTDKSTHFSFTPQTASFEELGALVADYDSVVVGSDQLWLPVNIAGRYFTLSFVQPPVRKVSYSTSFGVKLKCVDSKDENALFLFAIFFPKSASSFCLMRCFTKPSFAR